jgi:hypothetical protein
MRSPEEQRVALDCLALAQGTSQHLEHPSEIINRAQAYFAFVTGTAADDAKAKLDAVRQVVSCQ